MNSPTGYAVSSSGSHYRYIRGSSYSLNLGSRTGPKPKKFGLTLDCKTKTLTFRDGGLNGPILTGATCTGVVLPCRPAVTLGYGSVRITGVAPDNSTYEDAEAKRLRDALKYDWDFAAAKNSDKTVKNSAGGRDKMLKMVLKNGAKIVGGRGLVLESDNASATSVLGNTISISQKTLEVVCRSADLLAY